jgi:hypothetical protein
MNPEPEKRLALALKIASLDRQDALPDTMNLVFGKRGPRRVNPFAGASHDVSNAGCSKGSFNGEPKPHAAKVTEVDRALKSKLSYLLETSTAISAFMIEPRPPEGVASILT